MVYFSIGVVSGLIALAIAAIQLILPNALTVILVAILSEDHSAVTWSVVSRSLSKSLWPVLLRSDQAASRGVTLRVKVITWATPLLLGLIAITAVITPIGLHQALVPTKDQQLVVFSYLSDSGTLGAGTPPRSSIGFSRQCSDLDYVACPGTELAQGFLESTSENNTNNNKDPYDLRVPKELAKLYQSGLSDQPGSVSSYFDIQARHYELHDQFSTQNATYLIDSYQTMMSLVKNNDIVLVEGLVVDMINGGIAFRNHTAPIGLQYGAEWTEDLLFLEPETSCTDLNVTLEIQLNPLGVINGFSGSWLIDQGGFVNVNKTSPFSDPWFYEMQTALLENSDSSIEARAYRAGWFTNVLNMYFLNVTKPYTNRSAYLTSKIGSRYPMNNTFTKYSKNQLGITYFSGLINVSDLPVGGSNSTTTFDNSTSPTYHPYYPNPFNMTLSNWSEIDSSCSAALLGDFANITNIAVRCGLVVGPARRRDGGNDLVDEPGSWWTQKIYSCSSTTKATIKSVHFRFNSSNHAGLKALEAVSITDKVYQNKSMLPLWGVENAHMELNVLAPFWGLISPKLEKSINLSTIRSEKLYIPASTQSAAEVKLDFGVDFNPGVEGPAKIWSEVYNPSSVSGSIDYTGSGDLELLSKWRTLSSNKSGTAVILNLIWTDYAMNYFIGTRSLLDPKASLPLNLQRRASTDVDSSNNTQIPVNVYHLKIRYHWVYGIPAAITLAICALICLVAVILMLTRRASVSRIRHYLWSLSAGRILGSFMFPGQADPNANTFTWINQVGKKTVHIGEAEHSTKPSGRTYSALNQNEPTEATTVTSYEHFKDGHGEQDLFAGTRQGVS